MESPAVGRMLLEDALKGHRLDPYIIFQNDMTLMSLFLHDAC